MSKVFAVFPDPELGTVEALEASPHIDVPVGVALPSDWTPADGGYLKVEWDGTVHPGFPVAHATVRVIAWASSPTDAKSLALTAQAALTAYKTGTAVASFQPLAGPWSAEDPATSAPICAFTVRAVMKAQTPTE